MTHGRHLLIPVLLLALVVRLLYAGYQSDEDGFFRYDGEDYDNIAENIFRGEGLSISYYRWFEPEGANVAAGQTGQQMHPEYHRPPLLPLLGAGLRMLYSSADAPLRGMLILQIGLGLWLIVLLYANVGLIVGRGWGLLAALLLSLYPPAIHYSCVWSTETLYALLLMAGLYFLLRRATSHSEELRFPFACGLMLGLAALARPTGLAVAGGVFIYIILSSIGRKRLLEGVLFLLPLICLTLPFSLRIYAASGETAPVTAFGPYNMWLGNNPRMLEMYRASFTPEFDELQRQLYEEESAEHVRAIAREQVSGEAKAISPLRVANDYWRAQMSDFVREHPEDALRIWVYRAAHFWRFSINNATASLQTYAAELSYLLLLLGAAAGGVFMLKHKRETFCILAAFIIPAWLGALPYVFHLRFRFPYEPLLLIAAIYALTFLFNYIAKKHRKQGAVNERGT